MATEPLVSWFGVLFTMVPNPSRCLSKGPSVVSNMWTSRGIPWSRMQGQRFRTIVCSFMKMLLATPRVTYVASSLKSKSRSCPDQETHRIWTLSNTCGTKWGVHSRHGDPTYQPNWAATGCPTSLKFCDTGKYPARCRHLAPSCDCAVGRTWRPHSISRGAYRCSIVPIFHSPFVHQSLCFPIPMFPDPIFPSSYVPQSLSSPTRYGLCFPAPVFPKDVPQSLCSPVPLFPSPDVPHKCFQSLCSLKIFPSPYIYVPQTLCSKFPLFPSPHAPQSL